MQILLYLCAYNQEAIFIHSALSPLSKLFLCESSTELPQRAQRALREI